MMRYAVAVLVRNTEGRVLAVPRRGSPEVLCLPGGKVETGESPYETGSRELSEETGVGVFPSDLDVVLSSATDDAGWLTTGFTYRRPVRTDYELRAEEPGLEPRWVTEEELLARTPWPKWTRALLLVDECCRAQLRGSER